ncbi:MAG: hypothetical protein HGA23_11100 [Bacteroidales bacterium]|nr:hypothetical protein [Bacteroidales bacterium]
MIQELPFDVILYSVLILITIMIIFTGWFKFFRNGKTLSWNDRFNVYFTRMVFGPLKAAQMREELLDPLKRKHDGFWSMVGGVLLLSAFSVMLRDALLTIRFYP